MMSRRDDGVGLGERLVGRRLVAGLPGRAREVVALAGLVVADQRRVGVERLARVDDRGQRLVLDVDQRERVVGRVLVGRDHERDLLALEADLVAGEHGLRVVGDRRHPREAERLEVLGGDDGGDVRVRERRRGVDRDDLRVRVRAAQDRAVDHPRQLDVVEVGALAADEARVLLALQPAEADRALGGRARKVLDRRPCSGLLSRRGLVLGGPADGADDVLVARAAADRRRRSRCGSRARSGRGSRRAARAWSSASPACRTRTAARGARGSPAGPGRARRRPRATRPCGSRGPSHIAARIVHDLTGLPSMQHDAGAAVGGVAAPVRAGQVERLADEVHEQQARLDVVRDRLAVDRHRDVHGQAS